MTDTITTQRVDFHVPLDSRLSFFLPTIRELEKVLWSGKAEVTLGLIAAPLILETDACLMLYDLLMRRPKSVQKLTMVAMTSLLEGNVLIWLTGDVLCMRADSHMAWTAALRVPCKNIARDIKTKGREAFEIEDSRICELINRKLPKHLGTGRMLFHAELTEWIDVQPTRKDFFGRYEVAKTPAESKSATKENDDDDDGDDDAEAPEGILF